MAVKRVKRLVPRVRQASRCVSTCALAILVLACGLPVWLVTIAALWPTGRLLQRLGMKRLGEALLSPAIRIAKFALRNLELEEEFTPEEVVAINSALAKAHCYAIFSERSDGLSMSITFADGASMPEIPLRLAPSKGRLESRSRYQGGVDEDRISPS